VNFPALLKVFMGASLPSARIKHEITGECDAILVNSIIKNSASRVLVAVSIAEGSLTACGGFIGPSTCIYTMQCYDPGTIRPMKRGTG
jgi:hypothetical protein